MRRVCLAAFALALLGPASEAQIPAGGEFRVNANTADLQTFPSVAVHRGGAFVVVWSDFADVMAAIRAQRFDREGVPRGAEFRVNVVETGHARRPVVAVDDKDRFAVVWHNALPDGTPVGVFARVFDGDGAPRGEELRLSSAGGSPAVTAVPGGFVAAWNDDGDGSGTGIFARRFDAAGTVQGAAFAVNTLTTAQQYPAAVAAGRDGGFLVAWINHDGLHRGIFAQRFDAAGARAGSEFQVNSYKGGGPFTVDVDGDAGGNFVVVWSDRAYGPKRIVGRRLDPSGSPLGDEFVVNTFTNAFVYYVSAAADRDGAFAVVWESDSIGASRNVRARRFARDGGPRGASFRVNTSTGGGAALPRVASDGAGNLVVTWISAHLPPGQSYDVFGQRYGGLFPAGLAVLDGGNGVLEVPEDIALRTSWRNASGASQSFDGQLASVVTPPGLTLSLSPLAAYGTVASGAVATCGLCMSGLLTGARPAGHVDLGVVETILPEAQGQAQPWRLHVGDSFADVPRKGGFYRFIETLLHHAVTGGCGGGNYCPGSSTTRDQMAVFVLVAKEAAGYAPPACTTPAFSDVPAASPFCRWIEELARRGVTGGCGGGNYCPGDAVSREQMAVFVLRTLDPGLNPPGCTTPVFGDVPASSPFCRWIEELARRGIVTGCGGGNYCPTAPVTREQMAVFLTGTFGLTLYGP